MKLEKSTWNQFVLKHGPRSGRFLQSWEWGEFQSAIGQSVHREMSEGSVAQWIDYKLPLLGSYAYCPKGPIYSQEITEFESTKQKRPIFYRIEPSRKEQFPPRARKTIDIQPLHTNILDLSLSEDQLLENMHHKTRYNIRLAVKHGVHVSLSEHNFDEVWPLFEKTGLRGNFRLHKRSYYEQMLTVLSSECRAFLVTAFFETHPIATTLMIDFGDTRTYLHGASTREHKNLMAPHLIHWELIKQAKANGLRWYDWWGVAPEGAKNHPWKGLSRFKRGFGGEEFVSPGTYDVVNKPFAYALYKLLRRIRRSA